MYIMYRLYSTNGEIENIVQRKCKHEGKTAELKIENPNMTFYLK